MGIYVAVRVYMHFIQLHARSVRALNHIRDYLIQSCGLP